ncbi:uncharacterized protein LOC144750057 [Ciona intestinalis]
MHRYSIAHGTRDSGLQRGSTFSSYSLASAPSQQVLGQIGLPLNSDNGTSPFITVNYGDGQQVLVNVDCAILHLFLHLRARYLADGWQFDEEIMITGPPIVEKPPSPTKEDRLKRDLNSLQPKLFTCFDLLDEGPAPLEFCNKDPMTKVRSFVNDRATYLFCKVKRTHSGVIKEAVPLLLKTPLELKRRIDTVLRTIERSNKRRGGRGTDRSPTGKVSLVPGRREHRLSISAQSNRTLVGGVRNLQTK